MTYDHLTLLTLFLFNSHIRLIYSWICFINSFFFSQHAQPRQPISCFCWILREVKGHQTFRLRKISFLSLWTFLTSGLTMCRSQLGLFQRPLTVFSTLTPSTTKAAFCMPYHRYLLLLCSISKQLSCELSNHSIKIFHSSFSLSCIFYKYFIWGHKNC